MKTEPEFQGQHRIPQVYLKHFGYEKNGEWWISVYKAGKKKTENILITDFSKEINIFDLPFKDFELRRHFENSSNLIENNYRTIISNLQNQKRLTPKDKDVLNHLVPNLLCRTEKFRSFLNSLLYFPKTREKVIREITMFSGDNSEMKYFLNLINQDFHLNIAIGTLMNHMVHIFRKFKKLIIYRTEELGWLTTDNPVYLDKQGHNEWIIPLESEIYLPLSKDYCLFMFHNSSEVKTNPLRNLQIDKINKVDSNTFMKISDNIVFNNYEYLIINEEFEPTNIIE